MSTIIKSGFKPRKSLIATTITTLLALAPVTSFAVDNTETVDEEIERISVTGSRIKRMDIEGASSITVISSAELINSGFSTVGEALRQSNLNAFGSWGGGSNKGWASQNTVQLKGASAQHTLTLLDGRRMAKSPVLDGDDKSKYHPYGGR